MLTYQRMFIQNITCPLLDREPFRANMSCKRERGGGADGSGVQDDTKEEARSKDQGRGNKTLWLLRWY